MDEPIAQARLDAEWLGLTASRDLFSLASRTTKTYADALELVQPLSKRLYSPEEGMIAAHHEPKDIRHYRQIALARSERDHITVSPADVLTEEIEEFERLIKAKSSDTDTIKKALQKRRQLREKFAKTKVTENSIIVQDVFVSHHLQVPTSAPLRKGYVEYQVGRRRALRVRMLHPDKPEHITGADVIYEVCDEQTKTARVALVQYKIWDGETLCFSSSHSLMPQVQRLGAFACQNELCVPASKKPIDAYRMPHCTAFLRLTDRLQEPDAQLISSGEHFPVCKLETILGKPVSKSAILHRGSLLGTSVSQRTFAELFTRKMLGSKSLEYSDMERLYQTAALFDADDKISLHAQEIDFED
jgi:hypothetical protein